jgi:hypothetical protein
MGRVNPTDELSAPPKRKHMQYSAFSYNRRDALVFLAKTKRNIVNGEIWDNERAKWDSIPLISIDSKWNDVVKDFSIDKKLGHAGIVTHTEPFVKRDGRAGLRVTFQFINHTTVDNNPDVRKRTIEFIKPAPAPVVPVREFNFVVVGNVDEHGVVTFSIDSARTDACCDAVYEYPAGSDQYDPACVQRGYNGVEEYETASRLSDLIADALVSISYPTNNNQ